MSGVCEHHRYVSLLHFIICKCQVYVNIIGMCLSYTSSSVSVRCMWTSSICVSVLHFIICKCRVYVNIIDMCLCLTLHHLQVSGVCEHHRYVSLSYTSSSASVRCMWTSSVCVSVIHFIICKCLIYMNIIGMCLCLTLHHLQVSGVCEHHRYVSLSYTSSSTSVWCSRFCGMCNPRSLLVRYLQNNMWC